MPRRQQMPRSPDEPSSSDSPQHSPPPRVCLPRSRCSPKKFIQLIRTLPAEKKDAISTLGFGGLLQLTCTELKHDLCGWLVSAFDVGYYGLRLQDRQYVPLTPTDVTTVLGIPSHGVDIVVHKRHATPIRRYSLQLIEENLANLPVGEEFLKTFLIFTCATLIAPISRLEGVRDLWDIIWDGDLSVEMNWGKFLLQFLADGIYELRKKNPTYMRGCLLFLQLFYVSKFHLPAVSVPLTNPSCAPWTDALIKKRLETELDLFGAYGHVQLRPVVGPNRENHRQRDADDTVPEAESSEAIDARVKRNVATIARNAATNNALAKELSRDVETLRARGYTFTTDIPHSPQHTSPNIHYAHPPVSPGSYMHAELGGSTPFAPPVSEMGVPSSSYPDDDQPGDVAASTQDNDPLPRRRFKQKSQRIVKKAAVCKSPFVAMCMTQFPRIPHQTRVVADYAFDNTANPNDVLCDINGMYITRAEMISLEGTAWVNNIVISTFGRLLNCLQRSGPRRHYFDPSLSVSFNTPLG